MTATFSGAGAKFVRAGSTSEHAILPRLRLRTAFRQADFQVIAQHMLALTFRSVSSDRFMVIDPASFFSQVGVCADIPQRRRSLPGDKAGDAVLQAIICHSDNLEVSEQFDGTSGYEKSVRDLTWSYPAFLSAARAKVSRDVQG
jgi:hypothetical protein